MAKSTLVKCKYCGQQFNKEFTDYVQVSNRYAHKGCAEKAQNEADDFKKVTDLIQSLYYPTEPKWALIGSQLKKYKDEGMTYMGIYYTLTYFFVIKGNSIKEGKGVGIVPYVYNKAKAYYKNMDNTYTKLAEVEQQKTINKSQTESIVTVVQRKPKKKLIDFSYED